MNGKAASMAALIAQLESRRDEDGTADYEVWIAGPGWVAPATGEVLIDEVNSLVGIAAGEPADPRAADVAAVHERETRQYHADKRVLLEAHADYRRWLRVQAKAKARGLRVQRIDAELQARLGKIIDAEEPFLRMPLGNALVTSILTETYARAAEMELDVADEHPRSDARLAARAHANLAERNRHRAAVDYLRVMKATTAIRLALADYRTTFGSMRYRLCEMTTHRLDEELHGIHARDLVDVLFSFAGPVFARLLEVGDERLARLAQDEQRARWEISRRTPAGAPPLETDLNRLAAARAVILAEVERLGRERLT